VAPELTGRKSTLDSFGAEQRRGCRTGFARRVCRDPAWGRGLRRGSSLWPSEANALSPRSCGGGSRDTEGMLTLFGACAVTFMMLMYALERRGPLFILLFACGCGLSSAYGFLAGTWPFGVVELVWVLVAIHRYRAVRAEVASGSRVSGEPGERATAA